MLTYIDVRTQRVTKPGAILATDWLLTRRKARIALFEAGSKNDDAFE